mgnify:FL=1
MKRQLAICFLEAIRIILGLITIWVVLYEQNFIIFLLIIDLMLYLYVKNIKVELKEAERIYCGIKWQYQRFLDLYREKDVLKKSNIFFEIGENPQEYIIYLGKVIMKYEKRINDNKGWYSEEEIEEVHRICDDVSEKMKNC